jgi:predicted Ser/Thr protein kinase
MTEQNLYDAYMKNIAAFVANKKVDGNEPDEVLMRQIEIGLGVSEPAAYDFRHNMLGRYAANLVLDGSHDWRKDEELIYVLQQIVGGA